MLNAKEKQQVRSRIEKSIEIYNSKLFDLNQIYKSIKHYSRLVEYKLSDSDAELDDILKDVNKNCLEFEKEIKRV